jgi:peptidylprolyl isomerase
MGNENIMTTAIIGNTVTVHYVGTFEDGTIFDSSRARGEPITFQIGSAQVVPGFENAVVDMTVGESKTVTVIPDDGYGPIHEELVAVVPATSFPEDVDLQPGMSVQGTSQDGKPMSAIVSSIESAGVTLDFNHPLAGKSLMFKIELVGLND